MVEKGQQKQSATLWDVFEKYAKYIGVLGTIISVLSFSQGSRLASYIFLVVGYVLIVEFFWRVITQKSPLQQVPGIILPSSVSRQAEFRPRYSKCQRRMAMAGLAVLTILASGWIGINGWQDIQKQLAKNAPPVPPAQDDEILIIISQFENRGSAEQEIDFAQRIFDELNAAGIKRARIEQLPSNIIIREEKEARTLGEEANATLVIWGWFDGIGATPNYEIIKNSKQIKQVELEESPRRTSEPDHFSFFVRTGLPRGMTYLTEFTIGQVYYLAEQYDEALTYFNKALTALEKAKEGLSTLPQENAYSYSWGKEYVYFYRGVTQANLGAWSWAMRDYQLAIEQDDQFAEAYNNLGVAFSGLRDYKRAIENFDLAIKWGLDIAYYNRGNAYYNQRDFERAIEDYTQAIDYMDQDSVYAAYYNRGLAHAESQKHGAAIEDYTQAIELAPNENPGFYLARAKSYFALCQYENVLKDLSKMIEDEDLAADQDARVEAYTARGVTYTCLDQYSEALEDYQEALSLDPDYAPAHYNLAATRSLEGDADGAIQALTKAIELNPDLAAIAACDNDFDSIRDREDLRNLVPLSEGCQPDFCR